eukprot:3098199-Pyramimonas_sp.AAC.1
MAGEEKWFSSCKTIGCRYLAGITWTQSTVTPIDEENSASEHAKESVTAQSREYYENADCSDHFRRTCQESSKRSDGDNNYTHDKGCLMYEFLPNNPNRIVQKGCREAGSN